MTKSLGLKVIPSAFQIRFGGCKGVVSQDPNIDYEKDVLVIRNSMKKFNSTSKKLEILQVTNPGKEHSLLNYYTFSLSVHILRLPTNYTTHFSRVFIHISHVELTFLEISSQCMHDLFTIF